MADTTLQAESAPTNTDAQLAAYAAYRYAKASWDVAMYSPDAYFDDLPDEIDSALCGAHHRALVAYLTTPATTVLDLARKLRTFREEEVHKLLAGADLIVDAIVADAERLMQHR